MRTSNGNKSLFYPANKDYNDFINIPFNSDFREVLNKKKDGRVTWGWCGTDSKKFFEGNLKTKESQYLQSFIDTPVTYDVNKQQFRTPFEIDKPTNYKVIVTLGCSMTFGVGMYGNLIWPSIIEQTKGVRVLNLGLPGMGVEHSYIALSRAIEAGWKISKVLHFHPIFGRYMSLTDYDGTVFNVLAANGNYRDNARMVYKWDYWRDWMVNEGHILYDHKRAIDAITGVCMSRKIGYYYYNTQPYIRYYKRSNYDLDKLDKYHTDMMMDIEKNDLIARDLVHPSKNQHQRIAEQFLHVMNSSDRFIEPFSSFRRPDTISANHKKLY